MSNNENLDDAGVNNGDILNVLKGRKLPHKPSIVKKQPNVNKNNANNANANGNNNNFNFNSPLLPGMNQASLEQAKQTMKSLLENDEVWQMFNDPA